MCAKRYYQESEKATIKWERILANHISDESSIQNIQRTLQTQQNDNLILKWAEGLKDILLKNVTNQTHQLAIKEMQFSTPALHTHYTNKKYI